MALDRSVTSSLRMGLWRSSRAALLPPSSVRLLFFYHNHSCEIVGLQGYCNSGEREVGLWNVEMQQIFLLVLTLSCFSWIIVPHIVASLYLISRLIQSLILIIFVSVLFAFMEEQIFRGLYSNILELFFLHFTVILCYIWKWVSYFVFLKKWVSHGM